MRTLHILFGLPVALGASFAPPNSASSTSRLWSSAPGVNWNDSYLIGNGRIGVAILGSVASEIAALNEDSFWSGGLMHRVNQNAREQMPVMQSLIRDGNVLEAERLASLAYVATPVSERHFSPLGDLELYTNVSDSNTTKYERYLDINDATAGVYFEQNGTAFFREYFVSHAADLMAVRIASSSPGAVSLQVRLRRGGDGGSLNRFEDTAAHFSNDTIAITGQAASRTGVTFASGARVIASGGKVYTLGDTILCDNADEAWVYFTPRTTYREKDPLQAVLSQLGGIKQTYDQIRSEHVADYQKYAQRVSLSFGNSSALQRSMNTAERITRLNTGGPFDPELLALYFQFGRYLLISSSRPGTLPANLQGVWNADPDPEWGSKYTTNINVEMNYWPSLVTNLAEMSEPLNNLIQNVRDVGTYVAQEMYGASGWACHHNVDMWGDAAPQDNWVSSTWWPSAGPWLVFHLMEYYRFTGDKAFLREHYSTLKEAAQFYTSFLTDYNGWKVTNPTISPENVYYLPNSTLTAAITMGPAMDTELLWELFGELKEANSLLNLGDDEFITHLDKLKALLPPLRTNYYGGIMEWIHDYQEAMPGIDHLSPLWAAYPGNQITSTNETTFMAAQRTLEHRLANGGASGGWGASWCAALSARYFNATSFSHCIMHLVANQSHPESLLNGGAPAPFQIDGNLGGPAAIAEMMVQSHENIAVAPKELPSGSRNNIKLKPAFTGDVNKVPLIRLLPVLPPTFRAATDNGSGGSVAGLRARGGFVVDIEWDGHGKLTSANITSMIGGTVYVTAGTSVIGSTGGVQLQTSGAEKATFLKLNTAAGRSYIVTPS